MKPYINNYKAISSNSKSRKENRFQSTGSNPLNQNDENLFGSMSTKFSNQQLMSIKNNEKIENQSKENKEVDDLKRKNSDVKKNDLNPEIRDHSEILENKQDLPNSNTDEQRNLDQYINNNHDNSERSIKYNPELIEMDLNELVIESASINIKTGTKFKNNKQLSTKKMKQNLKFTNDKYKNVNKIETLQNYITEIQNQGFNKVFSQIQEKTKIKDELASNVKQLQMHLKNIKEEEKNSKDQSILITNDYLKKQIIEERMTREIDLMNKEIQDLKGFIEMTNFEISRKQEETAYILQENDDLNNKKRVLKEEIKKLNKRISDSDKKKGNLRSGIVLLRKHINILKGKINECEKSSSEFLKEIEIFTNSSIKK